MKFAIIPPIDPSKNLRVHSSLVNDTLVVVESKGCNSSYWWIRFSTSVSTTFSFLSIELGISTYRMGVRKRKTPPIMKKVELNPDIAYTDDPITGPKIKPTPTAVSISAMYFS